MKILIYTDNVSSNHILYYALAKLRGKEGIYFVNANEILAGALTSDVDLFVMPGGASRYKSAKLNGKGCELIKRYVAAGGRYLGICAGAYMASQTTCWAKGEPYEIITDNQLNFFQGVAQGPVESFAHANNYNGTDACIVKLDVGERVVSSLYIGGSTFIPNIDSGYRVVARFSELPEKPAAVVCGEYGQGRWLLSSTHPEYDKEALDLIDFNVVGNDYEDFCHLPQDLLLDLDLFDYMLTTLTEEHIGESQYQG